MKPEEAVGLARVVIDKYGADADKPSVHLAKALLAGAHERDRLRSRIQILESAISQALAVMTARVWRTAVDATASIDIAADLRTTLERHAIVCKEPPP